jgi:excisionase family DNA binding protein
MTEKQYYSVREVAKILSLSRQQVYNLLAQGEVPCVHFGKSKRIPIPALDDYLANKLADAQGYQHQRKVVDFARIHRSKKI